MKAEHDVVETLGGLRVHTHYYSSPAPQGTVILVNGSLATTAAFAAFNAAVASSTVTTTSPSAAFAAPPITTLPISGPREVAITA